MDWVVVGVGVGFLAMGFVAIVAPGRVVGLFGTRALSIDGRNEVRAVYGGFGLAVGCLLVATLRWSAVAPGVQLALATSLFGMAGGRALSRAIDRAAGPYPWLFFVVEIGLGSALLLAFLLGTD